MRATFFVPGSEYPPPFQTHGPDQDATFEWGGKVWEVRSIRGQRDGVKLDAVVVDR